MRSKHFFLNIGASVALYVGVFSLLNLLFSVINKLYPPVNNYGYFASQSISWPVATLIVFCPIFIFLMWILEKEYRVYPEQQSSGIHRWMTYLTLFLSGLLIAIDLISAIYKFIDGQEVTGGFLLKVLAVLVVGVLVFGYYLTDVLGRLTSKSRKIWRVIAGGVVLGSVVLGFVIIGSPRTQRMYKYDEQRVSDLMMIKSEVDSMYYREKELPPNLEVVNLSYLTDPQTKEPYEYKKTGELTYELCARFNKETPEESSKPTLRPPGYNSWTHPEGRHCFEQKVDKSMGIPMKGF